MSISLTQPVGGSVGWGANVNQNFQTLQDWVNGLEGANEWWSSGVLPVTRPGGGVIIAGDRWFSTIAGEMNWWYWDGLRWLSEEMFSATQYFNSSQTVSEFERFLALPPVSGFNLWAVSLVLVSSVATANDGLNYWTFQCELLPATGAAVGLGGSVSTGSGPDPVGSRVFHAITLGVEVDCSAYLVLGVQLTKVLLPGAVTVCKVFNYRLVHL